MKPTKRHIREVLVYFFKINKTAYESHRLLVDAYGEYAPSTTMCKDWFKRFRNGDFDVEDKLRSGRPKRFEDCDLKALIDADPSQSRAQLAATLGMCKSMISTRLDAMGVVCKDGVWVQKKKKADEDTDNDDNDDDDDISPAKQPKLDNTLELDLSDTKTYK